MINIFDLKNLVSPTILRMLNFFNLVRRCIVYKTDTDVDPTRSEWSVFTIEKIGQKCTVNTFIIRK